MYFCALSTRSYPAYTVHSHRSVRSQSRPNALFLTSYRLLHGHLTHVTALPRHPPLVSLSTCLLPYYTPSTPKVRLVGQDSSYIIAACLIHHPSSVASVKFSAQLVLIHTLSYHCCFPLSLVSISISPLPQSNNLILILAPHQSWQLQLVHLL